MVILPTTKLHWHMFTGLIVCRPNSQSELINQVYANSMIMSPDKLVTEHDLARGQQGLQIQVHQKTQGEPMEVLDVIITNISYLGHMSHEEFHTKPVNKDIVVNQPDMVQ